MAEPKSCAGFNTPWSDVKVGDLIKHVQERCKANEPQKYTAYTTAFVNITRLLHDMLERVRQNPFVVLSDTNSPVFDMFSPNADTRVEASDKAEAKRVINKCFEILNAMMHENTTENTPTVGEKKKVNHYLFANRKVIDAAIQVIEDAAETDRKMAAEEEAARQQAEAAARERAAEEAARKKVADQVKARKRAAEEQRRVEEATKIQIAEEEAAAVLQLKQLDEELKTILLSASNTIPEIEDKVKNLELLGTRIVQLKQFEQLKHFKERLQKEAFTNLLRLQEELKSKRQEEAMRQKQLADEQAFEDTIRTHFRSEDLTKLIEKIKVLEKSIQGAYIKYNKEITNDLLPRLKAAVKTLSTEEMWNERLWNKTWYFMEHAMQKHDKTLPDTSITNREFPLALFMNAYKKDKTNQGTLDGASEDLVVKKKGDTDGQVQGVDVGRVLKEWLDSYKIDTNGYYVDISANASSEIDKIDEENFYTYPYIRNAYETEKGFTNAKSVLLSRIKYAKGIKIAMEKERSTLLVNDRRSQNQKKIRELTNKINTQSEFLTGIENIKALHVTIYKTLNKMYNDHHERNALSQMKTSKNLREYIDTVVSTIDFNLESFKTLRTKIKKLFPSQFDNSYRGELTVGSYMNPLDIDYGTHKNYESSLQSILDAITIPSTKPIPSTHQGGAPSSPDIISFINTVIVCITLFALSICISEKTKRKYSEHGDFRSGLYGFAVFHAIYTVILLVLAYTLELSMEFISVHLQVLYIFFALFATLSYFVPDYTEKFLSSAALAFSWVVSVFWSMFVAAF